uniref:Origin recognition complex subunit 5 n=1 Tax=Ovis aries TaxID=9940 RepID=A0AC11DPH8_SHEEP
MLHLENMVLCRESQVSTLQSLFGERHHFSFPSIFIYGHTASGKTYVTQTLLRSLEGLNLHLLPCQVDSLPLSHQRRPKIVTGATPLSASTCLCELC